MPPVQKSREIHLLWVLVFCFLFPHDLHAQQQVKDLLTGTKTFSADVPRRVESGDSIHHLKFSDEGKTLLAVDEEAHIHLFDVESNRKLGKFATPEFKGERPSVTDIHFLEHDHFIICWSNMAIAELKLKGDTLDAAKQILRPKEFANVKSKISPDGSRMAMALDDYRETAQPHHVIRLFDFKQQRMLNEVEVSKRIDTIAFNAENEVAFGFGDEVGVLDVKGQPKSKPIRISYRVNELTFVGSQLYVSESRTDGVDGDTYTILNFDKDMETKYQTNDFAFKVGNSEFMGAPDGRLVFMQGYGEYDHGGHGCGLFFLNGETGESFGWANLPSSVDLEPNPYFYAGQMAFSPDGKTIAFGNRGRICFHEINYEKMAQHLPKAMEKAEPKSSKKSATKKPPAAAKEEVAKAKPSKPRPRMWRSSKGTFSIKATFVDAKDGSVQLKKDDGSVMSVPEDRLSDSDRRYIKKRMSK